MRQFVSNGKNAQFPVVAGRYHLYISLACPWANACYAALLMLGLDKVVSVSMVEPEWRIVNDKGRRGWAFNKACHSKILPQLKCRDTILGKKNMLEVYQASHEGWSDKVTVPILFDNNTNTIVNNESSEIIKMFHNQFAPLLSKLKVTPDLYPRKHAKEIETMAEWLYHDIQNGVYKCGFAGSEKAYEEAFTTLFESLDKVDAILQKKRYLVSNELMTYVDLRLYMCLIRFDPVYVVHFKTNKKCIFQYEGISRWLKHLYHEKGFKSTTDMEHIKDHYFRSHDGPDGLNPKGFVPLGPDPWWEKE